MSPRDLRSALLALALAAPLGCTVFDGVVPPSGGSGGAGGAGGGGGSGGAPAGTTYLTKADAMTVCARVRACDGLADAIRLSTGVPVSATSFSTCMTWLAGPLSDERPGLFAQRALLQQIAQAPSCAAALALAPLQPAPASCAPGCDEGGTYLDDCAGGVRFNCKTTLFNDGASAGECAVVNGRASCFSSGCCVGGPGCLDLVDAALCEAGGSVRICADPPTPGTQGRLTSIRCQDLGVICPKDINIDVMAQRTVPCAHEVPECDAGVGACADSDTVRTCIAGNATLFKCGPVGRTCADDGGVPYCAAAAGCAPSETACVGGDQIEVCLGGKKEVLGCAAGTSCKGASGGKSAGCE